MRPFIILPVAASLCFLFASGCMDPLNDYKDCVKIEKARCDLRESFDQTFDKATCYDYYEEYCRTREIDGPVGKSATDAEVDSCVEAISQIPCGHLSNKVDETSSLSECEFLWPKEEETDDTDTDTDEADAGA